MIDIGGIVEEVIDFVKVVIVPIVLMIVAALVLTVVLLVAVGTPMAMLDWYACGIRAEAYQKKGVNITQRELFMGVKPVFIVPAERIDEKDKSKVPSDERLNR